MSRKGVQMMNIKTASKIIAVPLIVLMLAGTACAGPGGGPGGPGGPGGGPGGGARFGGGAPRFGGGPGGGPRMGGGPGGPGGGPDRDGGPSYEGRRGPGGPGWGPGPRPRSYGGYYRGGWYDDGPYYGHRYHHDDGTGALAALLFGGILIGAIASAND